MQDVMFGVPISFLPVVIWEIVCIGLPIVWGLLYLLCSWIDDDEETFPYPTSRNVPFAKALNIRDNEGFIMFYWVLGGVAGGMVGLTICALNNFYNLYIWHILGVVGLICYVFKMGFKTKKLLKKHIEDKDAHNG